MSPLPFIDLRSQYAAPGMAPGDEVIVPAFTFAATAEVVVLAGATPVFVDIEPDTGHAVVAALREALAA